ncbi:hypothetical protein QT972_04850 [Microcoleus sp. herbarium7]|uniref:hypothetical protein n=1 Tax=Microcoleus sp. herbarium7 TaxID=3055435 RepID=UPI002FD5A0F2
MTIQSGFVHIIESPSADDLLDGRTEGRALSEVLNLAKIPYCYNLAINLETFNAALDTRLIEAFEYFKQPPILHLSMHGNQDGVVLTDNTFISWANLQTLLAPLTNAMEGGLLICMSSCFGSTGCLMAMHRDADQPFWALVGNNNSVSWEDAAVAYVTFYHLFFKGIPVEECVERMKLASNDHNFVVWSGHEVKAVWTEYMKRLRREQLLQRLRTAGQEVRRKTASIR